jgi:UDP-N-acetylmuramyl tripeptide synthase
MDEGHAAELVAEVKPNLVTVLNVVEDQLDRFVDPSLVREKLLVVAMAAKDSVVLNADDQNLLPFVGDVGRDKVHWFGLKDQSQVAQLGYAPTFEPALPTPISTTKVLGLEGTRVDIAVHGKHVGFELPSRGWHFAVDAAAALETAYQLLGSRFNAELARQTLAELPPVFARGEVVEIDGRQVEFILVQNPISMQLNLDNLPEGLERVLFAVGRDVHDPSWLWVVNPSKLSSVDVVTGFNAAEVELWMRHNGIEPGQVTDDLEEAMRIWMEMPEPENSIRTVIFSADAMRRIRRMLGFTSAEEVER